MVKLRTLLDTPFDRSSFNIRVGKVEKRADSRGTNKFGAVQKVWGSCHALAGEAVGSGIVPARTWG